MNYTPGKLFADCTHRYQVVAAAPEPGAIHQSAADLSTFMRNIIQGRLIPALAQFPEALAAYSATLRQLMHEYALAQP